MKQPYKYEYNPTDKKIETQVDIHNHSINTHENIQSYLFDRIQVLHKPTIKNIDSNGVLQNNFVIIQIHDDNIDIKQCSFEIEIAKDENFFHIVKTINTNKPEISICPIKAGYYYIRARYKYSSHISPWSDTYLIHTQASNANINITYQIKKMFEFSITLDITNDEDTIKDIRLELRDNNNDIIREFSYLDMAYKTIKGAIPTYLSPNTTYRVYIYVTGYKYEFDVKVIEFTTPSTLSNDPIILLHTDAYYDPHLGFLVTYSVNNVNKPLEKNSEVNICGLSGSFYGTEVRRLCKTIPRESGYQLLVYEDNALYGQNLFHLQTKAVKHINKSGSYYTWLPEYPTAYMALENNTGVDIYLFHLDNDINANLVTTINTTNLVRLLSLGYITPSKLLLVCSDGNDNLELHLYDIDNSNLNSRNITTREDVLNVLVTNNGQYVIVSYKTIYEVDIFTYDSGSNTITLLHTLTPPDGISSSFGFTLASDVFNRKLLVSAPNYNSNTGRIYEYELSTGNLVKTLDVPPGFSGSAYFGKCLAHLTVEFDFTYTMLVANIGSTITYIFYPF